MMISLRNVKFVNHLFLFGFSKMDWYLGLLSSNKRYETENEEGKPSTSGKSVKKCRIRK